MSKDLADEFIQALEKLETSRKADDLVALFADTAEVGNVISLERFHGKEGAREFWTKYRDTFETLRSSFRNQIIGESRVALEWTTEVVGPDGNSGQYNGVSILEIENGKIARFRAYFDPRALARELHFGASA